MKSVWGEIQAAAERHYDPGKFTTFVGYEWTSSPSEPDASPPFARNMHRNVIYRNANVSEIPSGKPDDKTSLLL